VNTAGNTFSYVRQFSVNTVVTFVYSSSNNVERDILKAVFRHLGVKLETGYLYTQNELHLAEISSDHIDRGTCLYAYCRQNLNSCDLVLE
jgi:hypothetical protein